MQPKISIWNVDALAKYKKDVMRVNELAAEDLCDCCMTSLFTSVSNLSNFNVEEFFNKCHGEGGKFCSGSGGKSSTGTHGPTYAPGALEAIKRNNHLSLNVADPSWDNAKGYLFDEHNGTLYFPVEKKHLPANHLNVGVLIRGQNKVLVTGELHPATSEYDKKTQLDLAKAGGMETSKAHAMLLDQRTGKARKLRYKLIVHRAKIVNI